MDKDSQLSEKKFRPQTYFIIAYVLLFAMALFWAVDDSIVYILFGAAVYFVFLGFYSGLGRNAFASSRIFESGSPTTRWSSGLGNVFQKRKASQARYTNPTTKPAAGKRIVVLAMAAIFVSFFLIIFGSIFNASTDYTTSLDYFALAEQQYAMGAYDSAYINYRRAWKEDETNASAMLGYGNVMAYRKQNDSAVVMYDKALELDPDLLAASYAKAGLYYNLERYTESIAVLVPVLQENAEYYDGMLMLGDCYYALRQYDEALIWYENAYENGGVRSSILCHIMAYIYDSKGDYSRAIVLYKEALTYDSTIVNIHKRLGQLLPGDEGNYYRTQAVVLEQR
jgi:tetratricopeptide (TPR) repeat protein